VNTYLLVSQHERHHELFERLSSTLSGHWHFISEKKLFNFSHLSMLKPTYIFIPHWSYKINSDIISHYKCVMFHMTDLPFGRGGSPLQNLIDRGHKETTLTAFLANQMFDAGPIYSKLPLSLHGNARDIFARADLLVSQLIFDIIQQDIQPVEQVGKVVNFTRRTAKQGDISQLEKLSKIYDYIRMLDAEGYPNAFLSTDNFTLNFSQAEFSQFEKGTETLSAKVTFTKNIAKEEDNE